MCDENTDSNLPVDNEDRTDYNRRLREGFYLMYADEDPEGYEAHWS